MANPSNPVFATFPIDPLNFSLPIVKADGTPTVYFGQVLQLIYASIQGNGGLLDLTTVQNGTPTASNDPIIAWAPLVATPTTILSVIPSRDILLSGTVNVTSFGPSRSGDLRVVRAADGITLVEGATLKLNNRGENIVMRPNNCAIFMCQGDDVWVLVGFFFDETTPYALSITGTVPRSLVTRGEDRTNVKDYGATGDGVTDDTNAFNAAIAAINAGAAPCFYMPAGNYLIQGDTTVFTVGCSIIGDGLASTLVLGGTGTSTVFSLTPAGDTHFKGHMDIRDFTMSGEHLYTRNAIDIVWATSIVSQQMRCYMTNVDIQPGFTGGIHLHNSIFPVFNAVQVNGGSATAPYLCLYGWHFTADTGNYTLGPFMTSCASASVGKSIWVEDHCEGIQIEGGCHVFVDYAFYIDVSMTTGGPEFHIADVQTEVNIQSVFINNMAYVHIHDCSFYNHDTATNSVQLNNCISGFIHDNQHILGSNAGTSVCTGVLFSGTSTLCKVHDDRFGFISGEFVIGNSDTADYNEVYDNTFYAVQNAASIPYQILTPGAGVNNKIKGHFCGDATALALVAFSGTVRVGFTGGTGGPAPPNTFVQFEAAGPLPMWAGEQFRISTQVGLNAPTADTVVLIRCREFNHRPAAPVPFQVFEFANTSSTLVQSCFIPNALSGSVWSESVVTVIANATDALPVIDVSTSAGTLDVTSVEMTVQRI